MGDGRAFSMMALTTFPNRHAGEENPAAAGNRLSPAQFYHRCQNRAGLVFKNLGVNVLRERRRRDSLRGPIGRRRPEGTCKDTFGGHCGGRLHEKQSPAVLR